MGSYQDTCQVLKRISNEILFWILNYVLKKGDSGGGQMCIKEDGLWYIGG